jgi:peptidoglycan hydrolase-like protein with peptidoglycan-binding domain
MPWLSRPNATPNLCSGRSRRHRLCCRCRRSGRNWLRPRPFSIQRELAKRGYFKGEPDGKPGPRTTQAIRDFQFAQRVVVDGKPSEPLLRDIQATKTTMKDELLDLVRHAGADGPPQRTVRDIQKALNKAGYGPLKEDGQWGPTTRQALTRFEQDNRLPMKGEPKGQNIKTLASVTGVQITQ